MMKIITRHIIRNRNVPIYPQGMQYRELSSSHDRDYIDYYTDWQLLAVRKYSKVANLLSEHMRRCTSCRGSGFIQCMLYTRSYWRCQRYTLVKCSSCNRFGDLDHPYNVQRKGEN